MFYFDDFFGKKVLKSTLLEGCEHFFTTRDFPLFQGTREDLTAIAEKNVDFLIEKFDINKNSLYRCKQMHTANVEIADGEENFFDNTDGIILTKPETATFLNFADCIPIILYDPIENTGGVVHAGWRGTAAKIQQRAVKILTEKGSKPENIRAAIGAGIGKCCFDVNEDVFLKEGSPASYKVEAGSGPRHLTFAPNGSYAYLINELSGTVIAFEYSDGELKETQTIAADTVGAKGSGDIHISPDGKFLYASNRLKADGLAIFSIHPENGMLTKVGYQLTGIHPRNFIITPNGKYLLVACRDSNVIQVYERDTDTGLLTDIRKDIKVDKPVCIKFVP